MWKTIFIYRNDIKIQIVNSAIKIPIRVKLTPLLGRYRNAVNITFSKKQRLFFFKLQIVLINFETIDFRFSTLESPIKLLFYQKILFKRNDFFSDKSKLNPEFSNNVNENEYFNLKSPKIYFQFLSFQVLVFIQKNKQFIFFFRSIYLYL
jgi:hypothetical protein